MVVVVAMVEVVVSTVVIVVVMTLAVVASAVAAAATEKINALICVAILLTSPFTIFIVICFRYASTNGRMDIRTVDDDHCTDD